MVEENYEPEARLLPSEYLERGWSKFFLDDGNGKYCLLGAILMWDIGRAQGFNRITPAFTAFTEALGLGDWSNKIAPWNNAPERTQAEVVERAKMAEVKLGLREPDALVEPETVLEIEPERELELVGVGV